MEHVSKKKIYLQSFLAVHHLIEVLYNILEIFCQVAEL